MRETRSVEDSFFLQVRRPTRLPPPQVENKIEISVARRFFVGTAIREAYGCLSDWKSYARNGAANRMVA